MGIPPTPNVHRHDTVTGSASLPLAFPDAFTGILVHPHARLQEQLLAEHRASP
nr:hypothetical protein OG999_36945 [Streptomyces sp. NBC_00886]